MRAHSAAFARDFPVEKVARIELNARLGGRDVHRPAGHRLDDPGGKREIRALAVQHEVVVVPEPTLQLFIGVVDARADFRRRAEIERFLHGAKPARGNQRRVHRRTGRPGC